MADLKKPDRPVVPRAALRQRLWLAPGMLAIIMGTVSAGHADDIIWARDGDIDSLDPHRATSTLSRQVWYQIYDSLLEFDDAGQLTPNLAREWTVSDDGTEYTFTLNEGILCHDGSAFDAHDVKWTADKALRNERGSITKASWGPIGGVEVIDDLTVSFTLDNPFNAFLPFMADEFSGMLCASNEEHDDFGRHTAIGTGPWKLERWTQGDEIVLVRHEDYHNFGRPIDNNGPPLSQRLIIRTLPEGQTRVAGIRSGELHVIVPPIQSVGELRDSDYADLYVAENTGQSMFLEFSVHRPPFDDERARQAVAHAIDVDQALQIVFGDLVNRQYCPISQGVFGNDPDLCREHGQDHDPERARELLSKMGYGPENPMQMVMATWTGDSRERVLQVFQNQLRQVGVEADIEVMDIGTLNARVTQENARQDGPGFMDLMGWTWFDPDVLYLLWHSPGAYEGYTHPALDEALQRTRTELDQGDREAAVHEVFEHLLSHAVHVPVYTPGWLWLYAVTTDVSGFQVGPFNRPMFEAVQRR